MWLLTGFLLGMAGGHVQKKWLEARGVSFGLEGPGGPGREGDARRGVQWLPRALSGRHTSGFHFLTHTSKTCQYLISAVVQDYYNITSDMPTDVMLSVAAENLETKMNLVDEEQHRLSLIKPLHVWISRWGGRKKTLNQGKRGIYGTVRVLSNAIFPNLSSALSPACHFLIPNVISAELFPHVSAISLHLLDLDRNEEELQQLRMETEDLALHLLHQV